MTTGLRNELGLERRVPVSEKVEILRPTIGGLLDTLRSLFREDDKPFRILYTKGESLVVERLLPESKIPTDGPFVTPFQMIRQYAHVDVLEGGSPYKTVFAAAKKLSDGGFEATMIVSHSKERVARWFDGLDGVLRLPLFEDPDCPGDIVVLCGSKTGRLVSQIEAAVVCRIER